MSEIVQEKIFAETKRKIDRMVNEGVSTIATGGDAMPYVPDLAAVQSIKAYHFRIEGDSPALI